MQIRLISLFAISALVACAPIRTDDDDDGCATGLQVCAYYGSIDDPVQGGSVRVRPSSEEDAIEGITGTDGCVTIDLSEGIWEWQASNQAGDCVSSFEEFAVDDCSTVVRSVDLEQWCFDGDQPGR